MWPWWSQPVFTCVVHQHVSRATLLVQTPSPRQQAPPFNIGKEKRFEEAAACNMDVKCAFHSALPTPPFSNPVVSQSGGPRRPPGN